MISRLIVWLTAFGPFGALNPVVQTPIRQLLGVMGNGENWAREKYQAYKKFIFVTLIISFGLNILQLYKMSNTFWSILDIIMIISILYKIYNQSVLGWLIEGFEKTTELGRKLYRPIISLLLLYTFNSLAIMVFFKYYKELFFLVVMLEIIGILWAWYHSFSGSDRSLAAFVGLSHILVWITVAVLILMRVGVIPKSIFPKMSDNLVHIVLTVDVQAQNEQKVDSGSYGFLVVDKFGHAKIQTKEIGGMKFDYHKVIIADENGNPVDKVVLILPHQYKFVKTVPPKERYGYILIKKIKKNQRIAIFESDVPYRVGIWHSGASDLGIY